MAKNHMKKVASIFGLELEEEFDILLDNGHVSMFNPHRFTKNGLIDKCDDTSSIYISRLIIGEYTIRKRPWVPKIGDKYYLIFNNGTIGCYRFGDNTADLAMLNMGNCVPTRESAEAGKEEIMKKFEEIQKGVRE